MRPAILSRALAPGAAAFGSTESVQLTCRSFWANADPPHSSGSRLIPSFAQAQHFLDVLIDFSIGEFGRHPDGVLDGIGVGSAMADDASPAHPQQRRAAVLRVVQPFFKIRKSVSGNGVSDFP